MSEKKAKIFPGITVVHFQEENLFIIRSLGTNIQIENKLQHLTCQKIDVRLNTFKAQS